MTERGDFGIRNGSVEQCTNRKSDGPRLLDRRRRMPHGVENYEAMKSKHLTYKTARMDDGAGHPFENHPASCIRLANNPNIALR